ncbi:MAG TPA: hypothetical protein VFB25_05360 [Gaiellaceae bacterium]|nr:hypothetical protein [Gaiellaceae bacterium]
MDGRALADLEGLAARDADLAERAGRLRRLDEQVAALRERAEAIDAFFSVYPDEESRRRDEAAAAAAELVRRQDELARAETALAAAHDEDALPRAEQVVVRARDHVAVATASLERSQSSAAELERDAAALPAEVPLLEQRAQAIATEAPGVPAPPAGPRGLVEWASHAHAELFVAARQLDSERDRVIREANELASMILGEPTYGSTVEGALARVIAIHGGG